MTLGEKPNTPRIRKVLRDLKNAPWLVTARAWWPDYLFHFTDIRNAVSILREGALLSRQEATERGVMVTDNASQEIISQTDDKWQDHVRLYFRPRTPTQYRNEGFRPSDQRELGAHCPVPVYFLFDSFQVLSREDSLFSGGNLASEPQVSIAPKTLSRCLSS
jgi:hypothetical protein